MSRAMRKLGRALKRTRNAQSLGKARLETEGGGLFGGKKKEYFETEVLGKKYRVKKTKKQRQHRLPIKVDVDTVTGEVVANPRKARVKTRDQVKAMQEKAVRFLRDVVKNSDKADEIAAMSISDYAAKKHITLSNPSDSSSSHSRRMRELHGKIQAASKRARVPVEFQVEAGGAPTYIVRGRRMSGQEALAELENPHKPPLGSGERFAELEHKLAARGDIKSPRALAAAIGRRKYGKKKFQQLAKRGKKRAARGNPKSEATAAADLYETFHQEPPREVLEFNQEIYRPTDYTVLGKLIELRLRQLALKLDFEDEDVLLASNAAGKQLYFIGGNQDLRDVIKEAGDGIDQSKDFIYLGEIDGVVYRARKEFTNYEETDWDHKLGEGGHKRPLLMYDKLNQQMYMVGGEYQVKYEGIIH